MRLTRANAQDFRNLGLVGLEFQGRRQFFVGANGQGKTNFLEAVGLLTALRSFRTADGRLLIAHGRNEAGLAFEIEHERLGETRVRLSLRADGKDAWVDGERVARMADFLGLFPTVIFCSQDQQLIRGGPGGRRRWLDLTLAATDRAYLLALQTYHKALAERNALLRTGQVRPELDAFEAALAPAAADLISRRRDGLQALASVVSETYAKVADRAEAAGFAYEPDLEGSPGAAEVAAKFRAARERDLRMRVTTAGPHRDDFAFLLEGRPAKDFASEGQQRLLVIALRLAQAAWFRLRTGVEPLLLADDVVSELDPARRARFWAALSPEAQVLATGTTLPGDESGGWEVFRVDAGRFDREGEARA